ncbi:MAG: hypothetical protein ABW173_07705 [Sphingomonas sp.]
MTETSSGRARLIGAVAGGLVAGLGISVLLIAGERRDGEPSELVALEREGARRLGLATPDDAVLPSAGEQAVVQAGHLALSAAAGAIYAATVDEDTPALPGGIGFGIAFYAGAHWIVGPLLGLKPPEWRADPGTIAMHTINHLAFGIVTAVAANLAAGAASPTQGVSA